MIDGRISEDTVPGKVEMTWQEKKQRLQEVEGYFSGIKWRNEKGSREYEIIDVKELDHVISGKIVGIRQGEKGVEADEYPFGGRAVSFEKGKVFNLSGDALKKYIFEEADDFFGSFKDSKYVGALTRVTDANFPTYRKIKEGEKKKEEERIARELNIFPSRDGADGATEEVVKNVVAEDGLIVGGFHDSIEFSDPQIYARIEKKKGRWKSQYGDWSAVGEVGARMNVGEVAEDFQDNVLVIGDLADPQESDSRGSVLAQRIKLVLAKMSVFDFPKSLNKKTFIGLLRLFRRLGLPVGRVDEEETEKIKADFDDFGAFQGKNLECFKSLSFMEDFCTERNKTEFFHDCYRASLRTYVYRLLVEGVIDEFCNPSGRYSKRKVPTSDNCVFILESGPKDENGKPLIRWIALQKQVRGGPAPFVFIEDEKVKKELQEKGIIPKVAELEEEKTVRGMKSLPSPMGADSMVLFPVPADAKVMIVQGSDCLCDRGFNPPINESLENEFSGGLEKVQVNSDDMVLLVTEINRGERSEGDDQRKVIRVSNYPRDILSGLEPEPGEKTATSDEGDQEKAPKPSVEKIIWDETKREELKNFLIERLKGYRNNQGEEIEVVNVFEGVVNRMDKERRLFVVFKQEDCKAIDLDSSVDDFEQLGNYIAKEIEKRGYSKINKKLIRKQMKKNQM